MSARRSSKSPGFKAGIRAKADEARASGDLDAAKTFDRAADDPRFARKLGRLGKRALAQEARNAKGGRR